MNIVGDYVLVEDIDELKERSIWDKGNEICTVGLGIFHDVLNVSYPRVQNLLVTGYSLLRRLLSLFKSRNDKGN